MSSTAPSSCGSAWTSTMPSSAPAAIEQLAIRKRPHASSRHRAGTCIPRGIIAIVTSPGCRGALARAIATAATPSAGPQTRSRGRNQAGSKIPDWSIQLERRPCLAVAPDGELPGVAGRDGEDVAVGRTAGHAEFVDIFPGRQIQRDGVSPGGTFDGPRVDPEHGFRLADVAEHQLRLARFGHDVRPGRSIRVLLHEMDRGAAVLAAELQHGRPERGDERELDVIGGDDGAIMLLLPAELSELPAVEGENVAELGGHGGFELDAKRSFDAPHQGGVDSPKAVAGRCG